MTPSKSAAGPTTDEGYAGVLPPTWSTLAGPLGLGVSGNEPEEVPQLQWPNSVRTYHHMRTDSQVDALCKAVSLPVRSFNWYIDPNGARDEVVAQVAGDMGLPILGTDESPPRGRQRFNHDEHLRHALLGLWYGHMFFQQVGEIDEAGLWHLTRLSPRMPQSLQWIQVDPNGDLIGIRQWGTTQPDSITPKLIPKNILASYVWDREGANWAGRSMLRPMYKHWLVKDRLVRVDALRHERFGLGIPTGKAPQGGNPADYAKVAQGVRATETAGVGLPYGADVSVEGIRGSMTDIIASIKYHDEQMARDFLAMFIQLGQTQHGSRALGQAFVDFFDLSVQAIASWYAGITTDDVIEDEVDWNWGVDEQAPALVWQRNDDTGPISAHDLVELISNGAIIVDTDTEAWIRDRWALPERVAASAPPVPTNVPPVPPAPPTPPGATPAAPATATRGRRPFVFDRAARARAGHSHRHARASSQTLHDPRIGHRLPSDVEIRAATNFEQMQIAWQSAADNLVTTWGDVRAAQIDFLIAAIEDAVAAGDASAIAQLTAPVLGEDELVTAMKQMAEGAITAARAEAAAQGVTIPLINVQVLEARIESRAAAIAELMARGISEAAARQALLRFGVDTLSPEDVGLGVREQLESLSDSYLNDVLGGSLTQAQNMGRAEVMRQADGTPYASELLDESTCENCADEDGTQFDSLDEAEAQYPTGGFVDCLGGPRCRGTLVMVYDEETASV